MATSNQIQASQVRRSRCKLGEDKTLKTLVLPPLHTFLVTIKSLALLVFNFLLLQPTLDSNCSYHSIKTDGLSVPLLNPEVNSSSLYRSPGSIKQIPSLPPPLEHLFHLASRHHTALVLFHSLSLFQSVLLFLLAPRTGDLGVA